MSDNVRIRNNVGRVDCSWTVQPGDERAIEQAFRLLADYQSEEPESGWYLETRGDVAGWHHWER